MKDISKAMTLAAVKTEGSGARKAIRVISIVMLVAMMLCSFAFASGTPATSQAIQEGVKDGTKQLYDIMTAIILPVAAVFFAWNAFKALFGGERGMEQAKKNMLTIVVVLALVYLAPAVITQIGSWFNKTNHWSF